MTDKTQKQSYFSNQCGKCRTGEIFSYFLLFNRKCSHCGHLFEKEEGHYLGAMIIAYLISSLMALPILLLAVFKYETDFPVAMGLTVLEILITGPIFYRYSKLVWIHAEERFTDYLHEEKKK